MSRRGENIYKRKDGRYEGRYVIGKTPAGRTRFGYVYARQYGEVRALLLQRKAERLEAARPASAYRGTLADWMERWMDNELLGSVKESSWQTYRNLVTRHLLPRLGGYALTQMTPRIIHDFVEELESSGLAESTVRGVYRLLSKAPSGACTDCCPPPCGMRWTRASSGRTHAGESTFSTESMENSAF